MGSQFAQLIHAAGESSPGDLPKNTHAVALSVPNEAELAKLELNLVRGRIAFVAIREPDLNDSLTCIGLIPQPRTKPIRKILGHLPLIK